MVLRSSGTVFEPIDEYKGDLARIYFYMAARYYDKIASWQNNGTADNVLAGNSYPVYDEWHLDLLLKWHSEDPVSQKEIDRNDACYDYQGNRNPFVDYPEFVCAVWGGSCDSSTVVYPGDGTTTVDSTADVSMTMSSSDYQIIVDYVNTYLSNGSEYPDNTEDYYGASSHFSNFDMRSGAYSSEFDTALDAIIAALRDVYLPNKVSSSLLNVDYIVTYTTYDGANTETTSLTFHCSSTDPLAFTLGAATEDPVDNTPDDDSSDTTVVNPTDSTEVLLALNITFDEDGV